jgi:1L-myo-inositol 1-phosphate cytidylyltransferase
MTPQISEAVILMAGCGSRLRGADETFLKPLVPVNGRPVVSYVLDALAKSGINKATAVIGFEANRLREAMQKLIPVEIKLRFVENPEWQKQNGISVLAARGHVTAPFVLTMSDHIFDPAILNLLIKQADVSDLNLAIDRKLESFFDLDDAMKVQTRDDHVIAIGKTLKDYDAIDTGLFVCPNAIFDYLERAKKDGDASLADGVRLMAANGKVRAIDIGEAWWQDVDTPEMLNHAEDVLRARPADGFAGGASIAHRGNR